jgi:hypothetical protein
MIDVRWDAHAKPTKRVSLRSLVVVWTALSTCLACAGVDPRWSLPCDLTEGASGGHAVIRAGHEMRILLVDKRPVAVPLSQRADLDCNVDLLRVPAGDHVLYAEFKIAGWSILAAEDFALLAVPFEAKSGREYQMHCTKNTGCRISDAYTENYAGSAKASGFDPTLYFDLFRAYAACGDEDAWVRLQRLRESGHVTKSSDEEWEPGSCKSFLDRR